MESVSEQLRFNVPPAHKFIRRRDLGLIAILCNHFTFYIGGSARVVSDFSQTFSVCVLSHKNMYLMVDSFCCVSVAMATASKDFFKKSGKKLLKISYF